MRAYGACRTGGTGLWEEAGAGGRPAVDLGEGFGRPRESRFRFLEASEAVERPSLPQLCVGLGQTIARLLTRRMIPSATPSASLRLPRSKARPGFRS